MTRYKLIIALVSILWAITALQAGGVTDDAPTEIESIKARHPGRRFQQAPRKPALEIVTDLTQKLAKHYKQFRQEPHNKEFSLSVTSHIKSLTKFLTQGIYIAPATATPNVKDLASIQYKFRKEPANRAEKTQIMKAVTYLAYIEAQTRSQFEQATKEIFNNKGLTTRPLREQIHVHLIRLAYQCIKTHLSNSKLSFKEVLGTIGHSADFSEYLKVLQKHKTKRSLAPASVLKRLGIFFNTLAHRGKPTTFAEFIKPYYTLRIKRAKSNLSPRGPSLPQNPKELAHLLSLEVPKDVLQSAIDLLNNNLKAEKEDDTSIPDTPPIAPPIAPPLSIEPTTPPGGPVVEATPPTPASEQGPSLLDAIQARQKAGLRKVEQKPEQKKTSLISNASQAVQTKLALWRTAIDGDSKDDSDDEEDDWDGLPSSSVSSSSNSQKPALPTAANVTKDSASSSASSTVSSSSASRVDISSSPSLKRATPSYTLPTPNVTSSSSKAEQKRDAEGQNDKDGESATITSQAPSLKSPSVSIKDRAAVFSNPSPLDVPLSNPKPGRNPSSYRLPPREKEEDPSNSSLALPLIPVSTLGAAKKLISLFNQLSSNEKA